MAGVDKVNCVNEVARAGSNSTSAMCDTFKRLWDAGWPIKIRKKKNSVGHFSVGFPIHFPLRHTTTHACIVKFLVSVYVPDRSHRKDSIVVLNIAEQNIAQLALI